jgi:protein phosphatase 1 regulatory subunit 7
MSVKIINGYKYFDYGPNKDRDLLVQSKELDKYTKYVNLKNIAHISVSETFGYSANDIEFLSNCQSVKYLSIDSPSIKDYSPIYSLKTLQRLDFGVEAPNGEVDLAQLPSLEELNIYHYKNYCNLDKCKKLKRLNITYYYPKTKNLEELSKLSSLSILYITKSDIDSFKGLGELKQLVKLRFTYLSKLQMIDELGRLSDKLESVRFDTCKNIKNHDYVRFLKSLKLLAFSNCGDISSIRFIKELPELKAFIFLKTNVVDGDLSPCIGLEYVAFDNKRHFSHKFEDFQQTNLDIGVGTLTREDF